MSSVDPETKALQHSIFWSKVRRAREMDPGEKFADGPRLFDQASAVMRAGILAQFPDFDEDQVTTEIRRRLAIRRQIDEQGIYVDAGYIDD